MPEHLYPPVGRCIYCGATSPSPGTERFGDEHIIPLAFGGNLVLREAACKECEKIINREIETPVLFKEWGYLRIKRNFPSRKKKSLSTRSHVTLRRNDGSPIKISVNRNLSMNLRHGPC